MSLLAKRLLLSPGCRCFSSHEAAPVSADRMRRSYDLMLEKCKSKKLPQDVNPRGVFACNELDLREVQVYGFDYDYTLACYKPSMDYLLYNLGRDMLIKKYKYPEGIADLQYNEEFAVRGLHYDIEKGLLLKLDSFLQIQLGAVYRGLHPVPDDEVLRLYKNRIIPIAYVEAPYKHSHDGVRRTKMVQLADLFSVPEMGLLCNVTEYFLQNHIDYHPEILFRDVKNSVQSCHPIMHQRVAENVSEYLEQNKDLTKFFDRLKDANKKMFLVTNSPFHFVNRGMTFLVGESWKELFDVVIVQARKPRFFTEESRPLRVYDEKNETQLWDRVTKLEKGVIYLEGTVKQLQDTTGWRGHQVLYFGDHPYSDLADVTLEHGWRTGAIIKELAHEIETLNDPKFKENANWLQMLTALIEDHQNVDSPESEKILEHWISERDRLRNEIKRVFNKQFGSVFRTYHNPTYFSRRLFRFADIYMSSITNLLCYSASHTFYPRRGVMPHEYISYFITQSARISQIGEKTKDGKESTKNKNAASQKKKKISLELNEDTERRKSDWKQRGSTSTGKLSKALSFQCSLDGVDVVSLERCPSCCPSENVGVRSLSLGDEVLPSERLNRAEAAAFSALIRDAADCLELLKRTLGDPNSEALRKSEADPRREIFRMTSSCAEDNERKLLLGRLVPGMEPVVPTIGEKMMRDRDLAYNVLHKISCELQRYASYNSLICEVNAIAEAKETECNLRANQKIWSEMVERMRETYQTLEDEFEAKKKECLEEIEKLDADIDQSYCANNEKLDYMSRWEYSKLEQQNTRHSLEEESILKEIESLERDRLNDAKVSEELRAFCNATINHCEAEILAWTNRFNDEMERRQQESTELQERIEKTIEFMEKSRELQAERHVLVGAYLDEQKRIEDEIKYMKAVNKAATLIQAVWRGYMVRHLLGPYADLKNMAKRKKSKKSKKKGKKGKK